MVLYLTKMAEWERRAKKYLKEKSSLARKVGRKSASVLPEKGKKEKVIFQTKYISD